MPKAIFCTSHIDHHPERYQNWIDYYVNFFPKDVDLWMFNDGPFCTKIDTKGVRVFTFDKNLGRENMIVFPGWKRSFHHAVKILSKKYERVGHIESDCYLTESGRDQYYSAMCGEDNYYTGRCVTYRFPEASLQILSKEAIEKYELKYDDESNWYECKELERWILDELKPQYILKGDRIEGQYSRHKPTHTYCAAVYLYQFLELAKYKIPIV